MKLTIFVLALLTPLSRPWLPMGNRSSCFLVANGINVAGFLLVVAGEDPCFGSQTNTALNKVWPWLLFWACLCMRYDTVSHSAEALLYSWKCCRSLDACCGLGFQVMSSQTIFLPLKTAMQWLYEVHFSSMLPCGRALSDGDRSSRCFRLDCLG